MKTYKKCTGKPHSFLINDTILSSDNLYVLEKISWNKYIINNDN